MHWLDSRDSYLVAADLEQPSASLLRNGAFVVGAQQSVRIYRTDMREPTITSDLDLPSEHGSLVDIMPGYAPNQFAVLTSDGQMLVYSLPSG